MEVKVHVSTVKIVMSVISWLGGDSYSVRIQALSPIVFNGPRQF